MLGVFHCKNALTNLSKNANETDVRLTLEKWTHLKEILTILQIPYKATIALQKRELTLSDAFGIWLKMKIHLQSSVIKRMCQTNFANCLTNALHERQQIIFNNSAMLSAIFLDLATEMRFRMTRI